jgi:hypothetical protein
MSTPPRIKRESVCPSAPVSARLVKMRAEQEARRQKMIEEATHSLAYLKTLREFAEKTSCGSDKVKTEMMTYFNEKIQDLETDLLGKPRYSYILNYPIDFGREANGVKPEFANKTFKSVEEVSKFIHEHVKSDDLIFDKEEYYIPSREWIAMMLEEKTVIEIDINKDDDEDEMVPPFTLSYTMINY